MSKIKLLNNQGDEVTIEHSDTASAQGNSVINIKDVTKQVDTIADLKLLDGTHKLVYVTGYHTKGDGAFGSHFFEWDATSTEADNGGTIVKLDSIDTGRYKLKYEGAVNVKWFGAKCNYNKNTKSGMNSTDALQNAFYFASSNNKNLEFEKSKDNEGYFTTKKLVLCSYFNLTTNGTPIYVDSTFEDDYVVAIGDTTTDYIDILTGVHADYIYVRNIEERSGNYGGVFIKCSSANIMKIRAMGFNGIGIHCSPVYDSQFGHLISERNGNLTEYAITFDGNGDDSNANQIDLITLHDSYHKALLFSGSKNRIDNIHSERNYVLSTDDGTTGLASSLAYRNIFISMVTGSIGSIDINPHNDTEGVAYDGTTTTLAEPLSVHLDLGATAINSLTALRSKVSTSTQSNSLNFSINMIKVTGTDSGIYENSLSRGIITEVETEVYYSDTVDSSVLGGRIQTIGDKCKTKLYGVKIIDDINDINTNGETIRRNCDINGRILSGGGLNIVYDSCKINTSGASEPGISLTTANEKIEVKNSMVYKGIRIGNTTKEVILENTRFRSDSNGDSYTQTYVDYQNVFTRNVICDGIVSGWHLPNVAVAGTKVSNPAPASGDNVDYINTVTGTANWVALTTMPS